MEIPLPSSNHRVRFRSFELNLRTRELFRNGIRVKLQGQPVDVLEMLLERPGDLVSREELRKKLWPEDTFVDFEHSLNSTIKRLRDALGDDADKPRYIETLPRLGYRFVCAIDTDDPSSVAARSHAESGPPHFTEFVTVTRVAEGDANVLPGPSQGGVAVGVVPGKRMLLTAVAAALLIVMAGIVLVRYGGPPLPPPRIGEIRQVTSDAKWMGKRIMGIDGSRVLLALTPTAFGEVQTQGGDISTIPIKLPGAGPAGFGGLGPVSPDGDSVLVYGAFHAAPNPRDESVDLWVAPTMGSTVRYLTRAGSAGYTAAWSPDGKQVVFSANDGKVYTVASAGGEPHLIRALESPSNHFAYSPDGKRIRFTYHVNGSSGRRIWEMSSDGKGLHEVLPNWHAGDTMYSASWTPDGKFFLLLLQDNPPRGTRFPDVGS